MTKRFYIYFIIFIVSLTLISLNYLELIDSRSLTDRQILLIKFRIISNILISLVMLILMHYEKKQIK